MSPSFLQPVPIFLLSAFFLLTPCALRAGDDPAANPAVVAKAAADRKAAQTALNRVQREIGGRAPEELEREICRDAETVYEYLCYLGNPRISELEKALLSDPRLAAHYAAYVLHSPWGEAEAAIARDPLAAASYATNLLCHPWAEAEPVIFTNGNAIAWYYAKFPRRITPEARKRMESDPWGAANCSVTEGRRRPELEPVILKDAGAAAYYAENVIKGRWPEAEGAIAASPEAAEAYAAGVVKGKWMQGDAAILRDPAATCQRLERLSRTPDTQGEVKELAVVLAQMIANAPEAYAELSDSSLLTVPAARAILAKHPGLRARVFAKSSHALPKDWKVPEDMAVEINSDAEAAIILAKRTGKAASKATEAIIARHGGAAADYAQEVLQRPWPEAEPAILRHPKAAGYYAAFVLKKPWPEAEPVIALSADGAHQYATHALRSRWPKGEAAILHSDCAAAYAVQFFDERLPEAEPAIARDSSVSSYAEKFKITDWPEACRAAIVLDNYPDQLMKALAPGRRPELEQFILDTRSAAGAAAYSAHFLKARWPEGEALILGKRDAKAATDYAEQVIKGAWPEAEPFIYTTPEAARYAKDVVKKPTQEAEAGILKDPHAAVEYAISVRRARWPEAEPVIITSPNAAAHYASMLVTGRWPEAEESMAKDTGGYGLSYFVNSAGCRVPAFEKAVLAGIQPPPAAVQYAEKVIKGRWPEAEPLILKTPSFAANYAVKVIQSRWPEAEASIRLDAQSSTLYAREVLRRRWPEAEGVIKGDPDAARRYAIEVMRARWPEAEALILSSSEDRVAYVDNFPEAKSALLPASVLKSGDANEAYEYTKKIIGGAWPEAEPLIARSPNASLEYARLTGRRFPAGEPVILKDPYYAIEYVRDVLKARWPEAEPVILRSARHTLEYARDVLKARWPEGEAVLRNHEWEAVEYAKEVIKGPFPEAEVTIAKQASASCSYATDVLHGRFKAGEAVIATDHDRAFDYVINILKSRWPEAEPAIRLNPRTATSYAITILKRRWPEAEPVIFDEKYDPYSSASEYTRAFPETLDRHAITDPAAAHEKLRAKGARDAALERVLLKSPYYTLDYATHTLQARWPEAEAALIRNPGFALDYATDVVKGRWPEAEPTLLKSPEHACSYAEKVLKRRWPEAEAAIASSPYLASVYAERVVKGPWPEAEASIATRPTSALHYARCVLKRRWPEGEEAIRRDAHMALIYASEVLNARWPEAEPVIIANKETATWYAVLILNARWPEFEEQMRKTGWSAQYVIRVIRERTPDAETSLLTQYGGADYMRAFIHKRDESMEKIILEALKKAQRGDQGPLGTLATYLECTRSTPWPEGEKLIPETFKESFRRNRVEARDHRRNPAREAQLRSLWEKEEPRESATESICAYASGLNPEERLPADLETALYAGVVEKSHTWPGCYGARAAHPAFEEKFLKAIGVAHEAEKAQWSQAYHRLIVLGLNYACRIRGTRWPALEKYLLNDPWMAFEYREHHAELRLWPELEAVLLKPDETHRLKLYRESADPAKFVALPCFESDDAKLSREEARILFNNPARIHFQNSSRAFRYARDVIRGRWPEFEKHLMTSQVGGLAFTGHGQWGGAFYERYRDEWGRGILDAHGNSEPVASLYIREIVRGPLPEYEANFAKVTESILYYSQATRRDFPAGEPHLFVASNWMNNRGSLVVRYLNQLLDDPGASMDRTRLFRGPDGARFRREALRGRTIGTTRDEAPGEALLREALESRE